LGPLLFIIYINDLPSVMKYFKAIIYADDTTLFATLNINNVDSIAEQHLNNDLALISEWMKLNKLSLNISKTKSMIYHTVQRKVNYPNIFIDGFKIDTVNEFDFLGIRLDKHLNWKPHVNMVSKKISKTIGILARVKNYIPKCALLNIYNALILPYLNYAVIIWGHKANCLTKLQKKAIRIITKSKYNAHTSGLFKSEKILKFGDICALHDYQFCYKLENGLLPEFFINKFFNRDPVHDYSTRNANNIRLPAVRHEFAKHSISYRFPSVFNDMPEVIKQKIYTHSFCSYKVYIKSRFIESYATICSVQNCYICNF